MKKLSRLPLLAAVLLVSLTLAGAADPKDAKAEAAKAKAEAVKAEAAKLEGTWRVVSMQREGKEMDADFLAVMPTLVFKGRAYTFGDGQGGEIADLDPTQTPKRVTYKPGKLDGKERPMEYGIYLLEGDVLIDCFTLGAEKDRPTEFASKPKSGHTLTVYKRVPNKKRED